jgi:hypothetical protein
MLRAASFLWILLLLTRPAAAQQFASYHTTPNEEPVSSAPILTFTARTNEASALPLARFITATAAKKRAGRIIGVTKALRPIRAYYFPGRSEARAMVIGGVHGSELASIEIAKQLVRQLAAGDTPFYNVLVIPSLFPDNAAHALEEGAANCTNTGRYSHADAADPNRQMPSLGTAYDPETNTDHLGRPIEYENSLLLQTIQLYKPHRIVNIHAIRDTAQGGIYADPRTDAAGYALEFASDSSLAVGMAQYINNQGGAVPGNRLHATPSALYYKDPPVAAPGQRQPRSSYGAALPGGRGHGVSLGSWASTAVANAADAAANRNAIRLLTMEFPGYKRPQDYGPAQQPYYKKQVQLYATAIQTVFLEAQFVEEGIDDAVVAGPTPLPAF